MTVSQFIERLQRLPGNLNVAYADEHGTEYDLRDAIVRDGDLVLCGWLGYGAENVLEHGALCFCNECMAVPAPRELFR